MGCDRWYNVEWNTRIPQYFCRIIRHITTKMTEAILIKILQTNSHASAFMRIWLWTLTK